VILFKIAFRNILRNARRSAMTMGAVAVGAIALILFGEFMADLTTAFETSLVQTGHFSVFRTGYFDFGAGNPGAYGIRDYTGLIRLIKQDPVLAPLLRVVTPAVRLYGIAGNFDIDASTTFLGSGLVPSDRERMRGWDEYGVMRSWQQQPRRDNGLRDEDETRAVVGTGLARILGLCRQLDIAGCPAPPVPAASTTVTGPPPDVNLTELAQRDREPTQPAQAGAGPRIDLLAATAGGAPNVLSVAVTGAERQGIRELDDAFIALHFTLAQRLLYGRGERKATAIVIQLKRTEDMPRVRARLVTLFREHRLDLEVRDFAELQPQFDQVIAMFGAIFFFIATVMGVIVLFTIVNTMSMSVMERTNEIGTARAMGVRRSGIRRQFVIEGWLLGLFGATAGIVLAALLAVLINHLGLTWIPPGRAGPIPLRVLTSGVGLLTAAVWLGLLLMATLAALVPANRAARLPVVDALRHV
jgi:putative ABC transport system permease protein